MVFIIKLIENFFGRTAGRVARAAKAKLHRETVGKVEGKIGSAQAKMDQKALRAVNKVSLPKKKTPPQVQGGSNEGSES